MSRVWFSQELETVANWWRIFRTDGVAVGFTSHDRDLRFDDILHRAAPGMVPSAIRLDGGFDEDSAEVEGALDHDAIGAADLIAGRFDDARVEIGLVDWETLETFTIYAGDLGQVGQDGTQFTAQLRSAKERLSRDTLARTSPTCRAIFCGPECSLSSAKFTEECFVQSVDVDGNAISLSSARPANDFLDGSVRFIDGFGTGLILAVAAVDGDMLILDRYLPDDIQAGTRVLVRQGCDHRWQSCHERFGNAVNFRGEPFLPGNDLLTRYPVPRS